MISEVKKFVYALMFTALMGVCSCLGGKTSAGKDASAGVDSLSAMSVKYATGFSVRDTNGVRLVDVGDKYHFALVQDAEVVVPEGFTKIQVPVKRTICMTSLQLSNFTILDAHDVVKGITGTKIFSTKISWPE